MPPFPTAVPLDEDVAHEIQRRQDAHDLDSVNEVLRHALDVVPDDSVARVVSSLPSALRPTAIATVNVLDEINFTRRVDHDESVLRYVDPDDSDRVLVAVAVGESAFEGQVLDDSGDLAVIGGGRVAEDGAHFWTAAAEGVDAADVITAFRERATDVYRDVLFDESAYTGC